MLPTTVQIAFTKHATEQIQDRKLEFPEELTIKEKDILKIRTDKVWEFRKNILGKSIFFCGRIDTKTGKLIIITAYRCNHNAYGNA